MTDHRPARTTGVLASGASLLLLAACVGGPGPAAGGVTGGPQPGEAASITVLSQLGDNPALQEVLDRLNAAYEQQHPEVQVEIQYLTLDDLTRTVPTTLASGAGPDVIDYDANPASLGELATSGLLLPLDEVAARHGWRDRLVDAVEERTTYDGSLYAVGRSQEAVGIYYNADLFAAHAIPPPTTYPAFLAAADALRRAGVVPIAFGNKDQWPSSHLVGAALHASVPVDTIAAVETLGGGGSWTAPEVVAAMQTAAGWTSGGYVTPDFNGLTFDDALKQFFAGAAGMIVEGTALTPDVLAEMPGTRVRFVPFPMMTPGLPQQAEGGLGGAWAIPASADAPLVAADWLDFVHFSDEAERAWLEAGVLPTTDRGADGTEVPELIRDNLAVVEAAQAGGGVGFWTGYSSSPLVTDAWNAGGQQLLDGRLDAAAFAGQLQEALEQARAAG